MINHSELSLYNNLQYIMDCSCCFLSPYSLSLFFEKIRLYSTKSIWFLIILGYSPLMDFFKDALYYVGLPEALLSRESDFVTKIKNKIQAVGVELDSLKVSWI